MKGEHPIRLLCRILGVSPSGYYRWLGHKPGQRQQEDAALSEKIALAHQKSRRTYGAPRIVADLRAEGTRTSKRRCTRLMKAQGLRGKKANARRPRTTDSRHGRPVAGNLIAERPAPTGPNQAWRTDITYLRTAEGWLFLAAILDVWSRRVIGWACGPTLHTELVMAALNHAILSRDPPKGVLHHSDRGSQYVDKDYVDRLDAAGLIRSMSRSGFCFDNAAMESFWATLKSDTGSEDLLPANRREAELAVFDYIETFYNPTRRHSSLGYLSPVAFEKLHHQNTIIAA
jgi:putative transposase